MPQMKCNTENGKIELSSDSNCMNMWDSVLDTAISEMRKIIEKKLSGDVGDKDRSSLEIYDEFLEQFENDKFNFENEFINHESETDQIWFYERHK